MIKCDKVLYYIIVCLETPFSKNSYYTETNQLICKANQLTGFCLRATLVFDGINEEIDSLLKILKGYVAGFELLKS